MKYQRMIKAQYLKPYWLNKRQFHVHTFPDRLDHGI